MTWDEGAIVEPLSVSIHAVKRSDPPLGGNALVFGAGAIGLLTAAVLQAQGMSRVVVVDIDEKKLQIAKDLGYASATYLSPIKPPTEVKPDISEILQDAQSLAKTISEQSGLVGFDRVYECTGAPSCVQTGIYVRTHQIQF
jgi:L-iditol 2-dehydrogenase